MGILGNLFGSKKNPYLEAGTLLTARLVRAFNLTDWKDAEPLFRADEVEAIEREISNFQKDANAVASESGEGGGQIMFHKSIVADLRRTLSARALYDLAWMKCGFSDNAPAEWKEYVSTYLKAWTGNLDPLNLLGLGELLVKAGHRNEARDAFQAVLKFPTYADTFYAGRLASLSPVAIAGNDIVKRAKQNLLDIG